MSSLSAKSSSAIPSYDVVIAGGGMVGATLAVMLAHQLPGWRIAIVDRFAPRTDAASLMSASTSFDGRSTVLSEGSRRILDAVGVWSPLRHYSTAIRNIHVSQRGEFGSVSLSAQQHGWEAMGYVIENTDLGKVLFAALREYPAIDFIGAANVAAITPAAESHDVIVEKHNQLTTLSAKLVVIADGANSALCQSLGIAAQRHDYAQCGLIANVAFSKSHNGYAYERFTDWGPMALLPLAEQQGMHRAALIWTFDHARGEQLKAVEEKEFLAVLQQRFGYRQGRFLRVGERHIYPLLLNAATEQVRQRLVVLGNAAHTLHPVAGQGFNLSLRDAASLADTLRDAREKNQAPFELPVLQRYWQRRQSDQQNTIGFSHQLTQIFSSTNPVLQCARRFGLLALDNWPTVKSLFTDYAAGTAAWDKA